MKLLNVLVACESSGIVRDAFRKLGHNAWSCDLLPCDGDPRFHIQGDVLALLRGTRMRVLNPLDELEHRSTPKWDLMIAHPPCTYLCNSGVRWLYKPFVRPYLPSEDPDSVVRVRNEPRWEAMWEAAAFFNQLWAPNHQHFIKHVAVENPIMHRHGRDRIPGCPAQIVQPWMFGHGETKATCLWLRNLPKLVPTDIVAGREHRIHKMPPGPSRWKERSKTFQGVADAMAQQWSQHIINTQLNAAYAASCSPGYDD